MKRITYLFMVVLWISLSAIPLSSWGQEVLNMPQFGKIIVDVSNEITFYDTKGEEAIPSANASNAFSTVVFKPAVAGKTIQIVFESVDLHNDGDGWPCYLNVYNGVFDSDNTITYPTTTGEVSANKFPETDALLISLDGTYENLSYVSTADDGALSVCFHYKYAKKSEGWVAKVRSVELKDMTVSGAGSSYEQVDQGPTGKEAVSLFSFYVDADGFMNADHLTSVSFTLPTNESVIDPAQLKMYAGQGANFKGQTDLGATFTESNGTYTLTLDKELSAGKNWFTVAGNISADAAFGSKIQAVLSKVTTTAHADGIGSLNLATPVTLTVPYMVLMSDVTTPYRVGTNPVYFYDDGGKDTRITYQYEGSTTFVPSTQGNRIQIDFTKVSLYESMYGSDTSNDKMIVYDGESVDAAKLNTIMRDKTPLIIRSNSSDGALTVYLKSTTGQNYTGNGFEAVVSEFTPAQMTVKDIVPAQYTEGTVCAGDESQPILSINVKTENSLPLSVQSLKFSVEGTTVPANLTKATVYYTAKSNEFSTTAKVGEVALTGASAFEVTLGEGQGLKEGDNYFWLAYDLDVKTVNGNVIDAGIVSVTCSDGEHQVTNGNPEGNRTVKNEYISQNGTYTKQICGEWGYSYTCSYSGEEGQQVTFTPVTTDNVVELIFSAFKLNVPSYYDTTPIFEIYSGTTTDRGKLIWKLTKAEQVMTLNEAIRPMNGDNSLTVVYNYNSLNQSSSYGWTAKVREYLPKNMTYDGTEVAQANTEYVASGSVNQEILRLKVMASGDKNPLPLNTVSLDLKGSQSHINKVSVFYTGKSDAFATDRLIGSLEITGAEEQAEIPINADYALQEGDCYYWIAYNLKANAVPAQKVDAKLLSLTIDNAAQTVASGDPEGDREIKNVYLMPTSAHETVHVGAYPYMFYDDGGADGKYSSTQNGSVTFVPAEGQVIKVVFNQFKTSSGDYLRFYNGDENSTDLLAEYTMYSEPEILSHILSNATDGSVTVKLDRTGYSVNDGWEIEVTSYTPLPLAYGSVTTTAVNRQQLLGGSLNEKMLCMAVETTGDKGSFTVNELSFAVTNSDNLSASKVYFTGTNNIFSAEGALFGTEQTGDAPVFSGSQSITEPGTYYFWLACDIKTDATVGAELSFVPTSIKVNDTTVDLGTPETATLKVKDGFRGTHTVGANGEYKTLTAAIEDMGVDGINGPVVLEMESGTYDEAVVIPEIAGTSATNTITIKSATGNYSDVTISSSRYATPAHGEADNGVLTILGADYLIIDGITFSTTDQSYPYLVDVRNASNYVTVRNCYFQRPVDVTAKRHLLHTDFVNEPKEGMPNTNMTIENNIFEGGYIGIEVGGQNAVEVNRNKGTRILNNVFRNQCFKGIYAKYDIGTLIEGNSIISNCSGAKEYCGIELLLGYEGVNIKSNKINLSGDYAIGIKIRPITGTEALRGRIYNNVVNMRMTGTSSSYGIAINQSTSKYFDVVNNTVYITGTNTSTYGFYDNAKTQYVTIQNNIFQNEAGGSAYWVNSSAYNVLTFNNNVLYSSGEALITSAGESLDMAQWLALGRETDSYNEQVTFLSDEILAPKTLDNLNNAKPLDFVTTDITGSLRNAEHPTIGAYEYVEPVAAAMEEGYPMLSGELTYHTASILVKVTENADVYYLCKTVNEAPTADEIVEAGNKTAVSKGQETTLQLNGLKGGTDYYTFFVLKTLANEVLSDVYPLGKFTTPFRPTAVSTFEGVTVTEGIFEDGTASFDGFVVEEIEDGMGADNHKAARMTGNSATVTLTNTTTGLPLTGFYLKSDADVMISVSEEQSKTVASTNGEWIFCNLKDMGDIASVTLSTTGMQVFIDDFSGEPQPITFMIDGAPDGMIAAGTNVSLSPYLYGGVPPYTYEWMNAGRRPLSADAVYTFNADMTRDYTLAVTDAWGTKEESTATVKVVSEAQVATFEDLYLADESYTNRVKEEDGDHAFHSGTYKFSNTVGTLGGTKHWSGFSYSNVTSTDFTGLFWIQQYYSAVGSGVYESRNYAVAYVDVDNSGDVKVIVANTEDGDVIDGFYISNNAWAVDAIMTGDGYAPHDEGFEKGDYFILTATGHKADGTISSTVDFYLADYRSDKEADHYYLDTWQWFDLRPLGKVTEISFTMSSTKSNAWGMTTPAYFCMDDFNGERLIEQGQAQTLGLGDSSLSLAGMFTLTDAEASIAYRIEDAYDTDILGATIENGELMVDGKAQGETDLVLSAVQKGKKQFVRIPVTIDPSASRLTDVSAGMVSVYPVPAVDRLNIATGMERYRIEIIAANGTPVYVKDNNSGDTSVHVGNLEKGIYLLRISNEGTSVVKRFTKVE